MRRYRPATEVLPSLTDGALAERPWMRRVPAEYRQAVDAEVWRRCHSTVDGLTVLVGDTARVYETVIGEVLAQLEREARGDGDGAQECG